VSECVYVYGVGDGGGQGSSTAQDAFKPKLGAGAEGSSFPAGMRTGVDSAPSRSFGPDDRFVSSVNFAC
jgi:hypothetical protein